MCIRDRGNGDILDAAAHLTADDQAAVAAAQAAVADDNILAGDMAVSYTHLDVYKRQYLTQNYPDIPLQKYDSYATAKSALENLSLIHIYRYAG